MKKFVIALSIALAAASASGRNPWTMEECMAYAAEHSADVEQARWNLASASADKDEALAAFFPSVSAQVGGQFNWGRNIDPETNTYNNVTTFNNGYGVYASLTLFDGGQTFNRYKQARVERKRSSSSVDMQRDDRAIATMMAYVDAVYYRGSVKIAEDKLAQSKGVLTLTQRQEELGIKGLPDVAEAKATVAGDEYNLVNHQNLYTQAMLRLRSHMNLPYEEQLELDSVAISDINALAGGDDAEVVYTMSLMSNPVAREAELGVKASEYAYKASKGLLFPTIGINAGISTSYYKTITGGSAAPNFGEQFRNNRGEYVSATISIPLFSNLGRISSVRRARYAKNKAVSRRDEQLRKLHDDVISAVTDRDGYAMEVMSLNTKVEADREAYELNSRKYEEGLITLIDRQLSANTYFSSRLSLLQKQMLYILKNKLVDYYKGNCLWM